jgi:hypothetical protein
MKQLYDWLSWQKGRYRKGLLSREQIGLLSSLSPEMKNLDTWSIPKQARDLDAWNRMYLSAKSCYPPTQKTSGVSPGMNASDGPAVALAPIGLIWNNSVNPKNGRQVLEMLRRIPPNNKLMDDLDQRFLE